MKIIVIVVILAFILYIKCTGEKHRFKKINFENKKLYLCIFFLYGNCNLKTNKAVISREGDMFLIETEDNNLNVESFSFNMNEIEDIKIREKLSSKSGEQSWNDFTSLTYSGGGSPGLNTTYTTTRTTKYHKVYDIKINLKNNIKMHIQSTKYPYHIFE